MMMRYSSKARSARPFFEVDVFDMRDAFAYFGLNRSDEVTKSVFVFSAVSS